VSNSRDDGGNLGRARDRRDDNVALVVLSNADKPDSLSGPAS
jgi:hypothetical protein